ncbi:hypothetical protein GGP41_009916 [Bipolaris sorokiniana]|uniref:Small secreted protein n=1 Tax=Cochliobolus sativus TaxID=45130 RepID=A0A8H5ZIG2_COCSA|nr:hypothetical protein GGP41_009916 [Bipolaris sorokiniana]
MKTSVPLLTILSASFVAAAPAPFAGNGPAIAARAQDGAITNLNLGRREEVVHKFGEKALKLRGVLLAARGSMAKNNANAEDAAAAADGNAKDQAAQDAAAAAEEEQAQGNGKGNGKNNAKDQAAQEAAAAAQMEKQKGAANDQAAADEQAAADQQNSCNIGAEQAAQDAANQQEELAKGMQDAAAGGAAQAGSLDGRDSEMTSSAVQKSFVVM